VTTPGSTFKGEPNIVPFSGQAIQVWSGTGRDVQVLFFNQDQVNTVSLSYQNNVDIGASNAAPLGPQSSISMNGARTIYANALKGTAAMLVLPGGGSFFQRITKITIPTGATTGARIVIDGTTGTITGYDVNGEISFIISPTVILMYH
jgi:hypothetical protein